MEKGAGLVAALSLTFILMAQLACAADEPDAYNYYVPGLYVTPESKAYLDVFNPGDETANVKAGIYYEKNDSGGFELKVEPKMTMRVDLSKDAAGNFGLALASDQQLVVDSVEYDAAYSGGFGGLAAMKPDFVWYFAEGYSSGMVKTFLYVINPNPRESNVGVTLYYENGEKRTFNLNIPAYRQMAVDLKEKTMPEKRFGIKVTGTAPIAASTGNYNKKFSGGSGGVGSNILSKIWYFPDGYTSTEATEFVNIINPSFGTAHVKLTMYYDDGTTTSFDDTVPANSKKMFLLNNYVTELRWFSTSVESDVSVVAENTHYDSAYSSGHGSIGATAASTDTYFAYSVADDNTLNQLAIFNPSSKEASLDLTFYYADGTVKQLKQTVPSMMRTTIDLNKQALPGKQFGLYARSSEPLFSKIIIYDKKHSAGYSYVGMALAAEEEAPASEEKTPSPESQPPSYILLSEDNVVLSKLGDKLSQGLTSAKKYTYSYGTANMLVWKFTYSSEKAGSNALSSALTGDLFSILEVTPATISGLSAHYFVSQKSEGYMWLNGKELHIFVGPVGESSATMGLAKLFVAGKPPEGGKKMGLATILLIIVILVVFAFSIRRLFRRRSGKDEAVWSGIIPSAKPKRKHSKKEAKKENRQQAKQEASKPHNAAKKEQKEQRKEKPEAPKQQKEHKDAKDPKEHKEKQPHQEHKESRHEKTHEKVRDISIKEIPRDKLTAQDLLDEMEEIPEYEDVFRHVNRDQEEIKPK